MQGKSTSPKFCVEMMLLSKCIKETCIQLTVRYPNGRMEKYILDAGSELTTVSKRINGIFISHSHADHTAGIPQIIKNGFGGQIYLTPPTEQMLMLDLASEGISKKLIIQGIQETIPKIVPCIYHNTKKVSDNCKVTFLQNAHILGAACIYIRFKFYGYEDINVFYTGDYCERTNVLTSARIPEWMKSAPVHVICESTKGGLYLEEKPIENDFQHQILKNIDDQKSVLIFAKSRNQVPEVMKELEKLQRKQKLDDIPIYVIGKRSRQYLEIYNNFLKESVLPRKVIYLDNLEGIKQILQSRSIVVCKPQTYKGAMKRIAENDNIVQLFINRKLYDDWPGQNKIYTNSFWGHMDNAECSTLLNQFEDIRTVYLVHGSQEALKARKGYLEKGIGKPVHIFEEILKIRAGAYEAKDISKEPLL